MAKNAQHQGWMTRWFGSYATVEASKEDTGVGYHQLEDYAAQQDNDTTVSRRQLQGKQEACDGGSGSVYSHGFSTYQMAPPPQSLEDYELQLKRKDKKPKVNSLWARIKYWLRYTWQMFKTGLVAAGPGMSVGPMMAPPPIVSLSSEATRRRIQMEAETPEVFM